MQQPPDATAVPPVAVAYLARGADRQWRESVDRFLQSYRRHEAGHPHTLHLIVKGFASHEDLAWLREQFAVVPHHEFETTDDRYDIGAYTAWAEALTAELILPLNTASELLGDHWLVKYARCFAQPGVGLVGATGSYESLSQYIADFPVFPNIHIRSTAFLIRRELFLQIARQFDTRTKHAAFAFESGGTSLTKQVMQQGLKVLVVGRDGRGFAPRFWPGSETFRQGNQENLLVADNQTRAFTETVWADKAVICQRTWGPHLDDWLWQPSLGERLTGWFRP